MTRDTDIRFMVSKDEKELYKIEAENRFLTRSEFIRYCIQKVINSTSKDKGEK